MTMRVVAHGNEAAPLSGGLPNKRPGFLASGVSGNACLASGNKQGVCCLISTLRTARRQEALVGQHVPCRRGENGITGDGNKNLEG
jgi:hypothetical protein